ncbi:hypothetical protein NDU88_001659 [Pleurodeles waltl]|uniref:Reverse transcriptase domain-containing protein n=1 Tax=Pleurodeles waltl TaxID=8319 RepID=A0AAV7RDG8_PLEWA|nr:hypothetical protein NDU88_001659 [Pleurodeles waltl]
MAQAVGQMQAGKAQGPNRFPIELSHRLNRRSAAPVRATYLEAFKTGSLLKDIRTATVVLILKAGKPDDQCTFCKPIFLLNVDTEILAKVLVTRLQVVMTELVNLDKNGFLPGRSISLNFRRLHNNIAEALHEPRIIVSLDANKFSDSVKLHAWDPDWDGLWPKIYLVGHAAL